MLTKAYRHVEYATLFLDYLRDALKTNPTRSVFLCVLPIAFQHHHTHNALLQVLPRALTSIHHEAVFWIPRDQTSARLDLVRPVSARLAWLIWLTSAKAPRISSDRLRWAGLGQAWLGAARLGSGAAWLVHPRSTRLGTCSPEPSLPRSARPREAWHGSAWFSSAELGKTSPQFRSAGLDQSGSAWSAAPYNYKNWAGPLPPPLVRHPHFTRREVDSPKCEIDPNSPKSLETRGPGPTVPWLV